MSQEATADVSAEIKQLISDIIIKNNLNVTCKVKYYSGSQAGDGYTTKTYAVDISDNETTLNLFLKCALNIGNAMPFAADLYATETYFYKTVYPTYTEFWKSRGVKDGFRNAPMSYGFIETRGSEALALENLRKKGFTLFDRFTCMNDQHLRMTLGAFAKFHAISFALKDQRKHLHDEFCERCPNIFVNNETTSKVQFNAVKDFVEKLDPITDKDMIEKCRGLESKVYDKAMKIDDLIADFSILTKGDCWVNNMMVLYENDDREHPKDVMLIDWQCLVCTSPVIDIQAFFYSVASKETVDNYKYYLDVYYQELNNSIKELGSDPEILYPRSVFAKEWRDCGLHALGLSLVLIKGMLTKTEDAPNFEKATNEADVGNIFQNLKYNEVEHLTRAKYIVRHMIDIGII